jgi:hypothetical protein
MTSHRGQASGVRPGESGEPDGYQGPRARPWPQNRFLGPRWLAALAVLILVAVGAGTWALLSGSGSHKTTVTPPTSVSPTQQVNALVNALILANESGAAKGLLPPATCAQHSATMVTCTAPAPGITEAVFQTYPSLTALYAAYTAQVMSLNSGKFQANFQDCGLGQTFGEVGWNHQFQHPKNYSVAQMSAGMVTDDQAAGRVFCTFSDGQEYFAWTQDDGHLLAVADGPVHEDVWNWWVAVHHNIGLGGLPMHM